MKSYPKRRFWCQQRRLACEALSSLAAPAGLAQPEVQPLGGLDWRWLNSGGTWKGILAVFLLFRFFDVLKPWPVGRSQALPGGWGVTVDDFLAAGYVNVVVGLFLWIRGEPHSWAI